MVNFLVFDSKISGFINKSECEHSVLGVPSSPAAEGAVSLRLGEKFP